MSIRWKMLATIFFVILVAGSATAYADRVTARNALESEISERLANTVQSRTAHVKTIMENLEEKTHLLGRQVFLFKDSTDLSEDHENQLCNIILRDMVASGDNIEAMHVINKNGIKVSSNSPEAIGIDMLNGDLFEKGKEDLYCSGISLCPGTGDPAVHMSMPLNLSSGESNVLVVKYSTWALNEIMMDTTGLGETGEIYIVNEEGYMITPSRFIDNAVLNQQIDITNMEYFQNESEDCPVDIVSSVIDYRGKRVVQAIADLPELGWTVIAEIDRSEAYAPVSELARNGLLVLLALCGFGAIIAFVVSYRMTSPIRKLRQGTKALMDGNLDYRTEIKSKDEIGQLSQDFDTMASWLRVSANNIEEHNRTLELKIQERTSELEEANAAMEEEITERKQVEEKLAESKERIQAILNSVQAGVLIVDAETHRIEYVNPAASAMIGTQAADICNKVCHDFVCPNKVGECPISDLGQKIDNSERVLLTVDGKKCAILKTVTPIVLENHQCLIETFIDIDERKKAEEALKESETHYHRLFESSRDAIMTLAPPSWRFKSGNHATCEMFGVENPDEFSALGPWDVSPDHQPDGRLSAEKAKEMIETAMNTGSHVFEWTHKKSDGTEFFTVVTLTRMESRDEAFLQAIVRDITESKRIEESLRMIKQAIESSNEAIAISDPWGNHLFQNNAFTEMFEYSAEELLDSGGSLGILGNQKVSQEIYNTAMAGQSWTGEFETFSKTGRRFHVYLRVNSVFDDIGKIIGLIGVYTDITERKKMETQLTKYAITDELTELYNRRYFFESIDRMISEVKRTRECFSLAIIDIDNFKTYNDTFGHVNGDHVLREFALALKLSLRESDLAFRYGGDEFIILYPETDASGASEQLERLNKLWEEIAQTKESVIQTNLRFSAGIGEFPKNAVTVDSLMFLADAALYHSKKHTKSQIMLVSDFRSISLEDKGMLLTEQAYVLVSMIEAKDLKTYQHSTNVAEIACMMSSKMGHSDDMVKKLHAAALLHDIGKVGVPEVILTKDKGLSPEEWDTVKIHPIQGANIVGHLKGLEELVPAILHHHEDYDGNGYPIGLSGRKIPLEARILRIADSYDTMTAKRPYKKAISHKEAIEEILKCSGIQFDPELVKVFHQLMTENVADSTNEQLVS